MPLHRQARGNLFIRDTCGSKADNLCFHFLGCRERCERMALHRDQQRGRFATDPNDACLHAITGEAMQGDLVDQTTQERFFLFA